MTHVRLAQVTEEVLASVLRTAWNLGVDKNKKSAGAKSVRRD